MMLKKSLEQARIHYPMDYPCRCMNCREDIDDFLSHIHWENDTDDGRYHGFEIICPFCDQTFWLWEEDDTGGQFYGDYFGPYAHRPVHPLEEAPGSGES